MKRFNSRCSSSVVVVVALLLTGTRSGWAAQPHVGTSETSITPDRVQSKD